MTRRLSVITIGLALVVSLAASACSGENSNADLQVDLADFSIDLSTDSVTAGELTINAANSGPSTHEIEVFSVPEGVDVGAIEIVDDVADVDSAGLELVDEVDDIVAGSSSELTLSLESGSYAVICNLPGHYGEGMHASLTVE
jgi:uncharacterized cupredoxin-like copper-binding protein